MSAPGAVEIARFGDPEDVLASRNLGFFVVRFDPPFEPPYQITNIAFPSLTKDGSPAVFPSVRLCGAMASGVPDLANPLLVEAPFTGSSDGWNEIPVNISVPDSGRIFYVCVEMPSTASAGFPNGYPFLRMDYRDFDRGYFADTYEILPTGRFQANRGRNIVIALDFQVDPVLVPIQSTSNIGTNRLSDGFEFRFLKPTDVAADGTAMGHHALWRTELLSRTEFGPWTPVTSVGSGHSSVTVPWAYPSRIWSTQAIDRSGHRAVPSNAAFDLFRTAFDMDEPNGSLREATLITPSRYYRFGASYPAGDKDFFRFHANPGEDLRAKAGVIGRDGISDLELVLLLYDDRGMLVATSDSSGSWAASLEYVVPARGASDKAREFTLEVADVRGSELSPLTCPRTDLVWNPEYALVVYPDGPLELARSFSSHDERHRRLGILGPNPVSGSRVLFTLPDMSGMRSPILQVFDVNGRLVRSTMVTGRDAGGVVAWDRSDQSGKRVASGIYFARLWPSEHRIRVALLP